MRTLAELQKLRAELSERFQKVTASVENETPTEEQDAEISAIRSEIEEVAGEIAQAEAKRESYKAALNATNSAFKAADIKAHVPVIPDGYRKESIPTTRASKIEQEAKSRISPRARSIYKDDKGLAAVGAQFIGALKGDASCVDAINATYTQFDAVMNTTDNALGGYIVPDELIPTLIDLREQYGVIRANANIRNVDAPSGRQARRVGRPRAIWEGEPRTEDSPTQDITFDNISYQVRGLRAYTEVTREQEQDSIIDLSALIFMHAAEDFAQTEDEACFLGDGTSDYGGIQGIMHVLGLAAHAGSVTTAGTGEDIFADLEMGSILDLMGKVPRFAKVGDEAKFFISELGKSLSLDRIKLEGGGNTVQIIEGQLVERFLGRRMEISQVLPEATTGTATTLGFLFGNMRMAATLFQKNGILMERSEHAEFKKDHIVYKTVQRLDFNFHERGTATTSGPLRALKFAS